MIRLLVVLYVLFISSVACDPKSESSEPDQTSSPAESAVTEAPTKAPEVDPKLYMKFVERGLLKKQKDITICTLPWSEEFPDRELEVKLVFELMPSGKVERVKAHVPREGARIGHCIERVIMKTQFSPGAPPEPFRKTMVFNPQDEAVKQMKVGDLPPKPNDTTSGTTSGTTAGDAPSTP